MPWAGWNVSNGNSVHSAIQRECAVCRLLHMSPVLRSVLRHTVESEPPLLFVATQKALHALPLAPQSTVIYSLALPGNTPDVSMEILSLHVVAKATLSGAAHNGSALVSAVARQPGESDLWSFLVAATTGEIVEKKRIEENDTSVRKCLFL